MSVLQKLITVLPGMFSFVLSLSHNSLLRHLVMSSSLHGRDLCGAGVLSILLVDA